jgi:ABC-type Mn2+/Zn2+ transport system permease subunit
VRLPAPSLRALRSWTIALGAAEGVAGLVIADALNVGPGPALAVLAGATFAVVAIARGRR